MAAEINASKPAGTLYLISIQVLSRGLTFIGNQAVLRYVSPADLGLAVQLEALSISVLYTARESLRVALQRCPRPVSSEDQTSRNAVNTQAAINTAYFVVLLGIALGGGFSTFYLSTAGLDVRVAQDFVLSFRIYALATVVELLSEPGFLVTQQQSLFRARAFAETTAAILRCVGAVSTAWYMAFHDRPASTLPFAIGQLMYATALLMLYLSSAKTSIRDREVSLIPRALKADYVVIGLIPRQLLNLAGAFYGQSILKWLLTQGDTLVLSYFADLKSQGVFALASNYGGLASRLLFQPIEESSRTTFGRLLSTTDSKPDGRNDLVRGRKEALRYLSTVVHGYLVLVAFPCTTILPKVFPLAIQILLGPRSSFFTPRTASLLAVYSYYLPFLALNGVLDAFVTSIASEGELAEQSLAMAGVTVLYISTAATFTNHLVTAEVGLVFANILNMTLRILFSLWFARAWVQQKVPEMNGNAFSDFTAACLPHKTLLSVWAAIEIGIWSEVYVKQQIRIRTGLAFFNIGGVHIEVAEISYIMSISLIVTSTILLTEAHFILRTFGHMLPARFRPHIRDDGKKEQ